MRFADLLVDLAAVVSASRSVAGKHVALRASQIDRYSKTSSIAGLAKDLGKGKQQHQQQQYYQQQTPETQQQDVVQSQSQQPEQGVRVGEVVRVKEEVPVQQQPAPVDAQSEVPPSPPASEAKMTAAAPEPPKSTPKPFTPAPWANRKPLPQPSPFPKPPRIGVKSIIPGLPADLAALKGEASVGEADVDLSSIFMTNKGSKILEELNKEPTVPGVEVTPEPVPAVVPEPKPVEEQSVQKTADEEVEQPKVEEDKSTVPETPAAAVKATPPQEPKTPKLTQEDADLVAELTGSSPLPASTRHELRESKVPASRISRLWNYGGLAAGMMAGAIGEGFSRAIGGGSSGSVMLSPGNVERLVSRLSRMRGAALKLGQMMSIQDSKMLPPTIQEVFQRVQDRADYMPAWQRDRVLVSNLGADWRLLFDEFQEKPIAAASIGQVHRATLKSNGARVAVKIQFPGVADSINSDLDNLAILLAATKLLPKGLYLNKTIDNARTELAWECDYLREAECAARYRELLAAGGQEDAIFAVPHIFQEASGKQVLTMEWMDGVGVTRIADFSQEQKDWIGTQILRLCLREITEFKFMQTDPNWTNFLYNPQKQRLELLDFGASREYPDEFISLYIRLLEAASRGDRPAVKSLSEELGYLTGHESKAMLEAHITSVITLAEPFLRSAPEVYDFRDQTITERVKAQIPVMIHERLAPPPEETYSLHRKLSGAFLLCARLGSRVRCREMFERALEKTAYFGGNGGKRQ
ncbi:ABC1 family-domain-containing protein [Pseudoneurospora amorphoporcata]|uniref:ABC1 family-domain-containing protein n=1 Tax=Pseudoneurospora amorphoporcata TaxID=241081 RepID=A0AAN6P1V3_9PEZI|nr:ABC1 family-domain-containing protein [Pseudoneurospora amorphoporcata]